MYKNWNVLALIPARGASKGLARKNLRLLAGKPLVAHSILKANQSPYIDRIVVSTDDQTIAATAKKYGAEVPFIRPKQLAGNLTPDYPVVRHALDWLAKYENWRPDIIVFLRPTGPLRTVKQIDDGIRLLADHPKADSVRSVNEAYFTPYKMWTLGRPYMKPLLKLKGNPEPYMSPRQVLPAVYQTNPYVHVMWTKTVFKKKSVIGKKVLPLIIKCHVVDIDSELDLAVAELISRGKG